MYDDLGPEHILKVYDPETGMKGIICLDNTVRGPAKGGIRMTPTVDEEEVFGLARAMTLKNALANLPFGGGKSGIIADAKKLSPEEKKAIVKAYARKIKHVAPDLYIAAPDIAMAEEEMRWIAEEIGKTTVTGKPTDMGGIPHELGSTGYGVYVSVRELLKLQGDTLKGKKVSIQGFGNVGMFAAHFMAEDGAIIVAASDSTTTLIDENGLDVAALKKHKEGRGRLIDIEGEHLNSDAALFVDCDILIPAAQKHVITEDNYTEVQAKIISQGANLPIPDDVEVALEKKGVHIIPDILANAGGVISSYIEHIGGTHDEIFEKIEEIIANNVQEIEKDITDSSCSAREACLHIAKKRILKN